MALAGCQVRPLYDDASGTGESLGSIVYSAASNRVGQEVRNHLIFLTGGGAGEPANPEYEVNLQVSATTMGVLLDQSSDTAKAGRFIVSANYTLKRASDATVLHTGRRQVVAVVDYPSQEFAKLRAVRDGEDRAARELAEFIRADLASALGR
ncbi:MAG: hypothetical protein ACYC10_06760 [Allorhizobium sp.]